MSSHKLPLSHRLAAHFSSRFVPVITRDHLIHATRVRVYFRLFNTYYHVSDWLLSDASIQEDRAGNCTLILSSAKNIYGNSRRMTAIAEQIAQGGESNFAQAIKIKDLNHNI